MASSSSLDQREHEHAQDPSANGADINDVRDRDSSATGNNIGLEDPFVTGMINVFGRNHEIHEMEIPPICVFHVPRFLSNSKPEAYSPKVIGLGPLYHFSSPLQMDKVVVARKIHNEFGHIIEFQELIQGLVKLGPSIRACYQMYFSTDDGDERIAFTMAIDGLFLFALLCHSNRGEEALTSSDTLLRLIDHTDMGRLSSDEILGDTMMLQNQIPIFVLKHILLMECSEQLIAEENLPRLLLGYCKELSPFEVVNNYPDSMALKRAHMLDLLYQLITLTEDELEELIELERGKRVSCVLSLGIREARRADLLQLVVNRVLDILSGLALPKEVKKAIELVKGLLDLPWSLLLSSIGNKDGVGDQVPTASMLSDVGVKFSPVHITDIRFNRETASIMLPVLQVNANSEIILRNLLAYEVDWPHIYPRHRVFREYIQWMSALVKTGKDVKVLRDHDILEFTGYMKDEEKDEEVAKIFSGMREPIFSAQDQQDDFDENVLGDISQYYNGLRKVKVRKFVKQILKLFVNILVWLVVFLRLFGSVYGYPLVLEKSKSFCGSIISWVPIRLLSFSWTRTSSDQLLSSGMPASGSCLGNAGE